MENLIQIQILVLFECVCVLMTLLTGPAPGQHL